MRQNSVKITPRGHGTPTTIAEEMDTLQGRNSTTMPRQKTSLIGRAKDQLTLHCSNRALFYKVGLVVQKFDLISTYVDLKFELTNNIKVTL